MVPARLHVTFIEFGAIALREALAKLGVDERVISLPDDLGFGPLEPFSVEARAAFEHQAFGTKVDPEWNALIQAFWDDVAQPDAEAIVWLSRWHVQELAGCMELLSRCNEPPIVIDIADTMFMHRKPYPSASRGLPMLSADQFIEHRLLEHATRLPDKTFETYRARWATLRQENAPLLRCSS